MDVRWTLFWRCVPAGNALFKASIVFLRENSNFKPQSWVWKYILAFQNKEGILQRNKVFPNYDLIAEGGNWVFSERVNLRIKVNDSSQTALIKYQFDYEHFILIYQMLVRNGWF